MTSVAQNRGVFWRALAPPSIRKCDKIRKHLAVSAHASSPQCRRGKRTSYFPENAASDGGASNSVVRRVTEHEDFARYDRAARIGSALFGLFHLSAPTPVERLQRPSQFIPPGMTGIPCWRIDRSDHLEPGHWRGNHGSRGGRLRSARRPRTFPAPARTFPVRRMSQGHGYRLATPHWAGETPQQMFPLGAAPKVERMRSMRPRAHLADTGPGEGGPTLEPPQTFCPMRWQFEESDL